MYTRWEKIKEVWFGIAGVAIGAANAVMFLIIVLTGAAYVYENIRWILYTEFVLAVLFTWWAIQMLIDDWRQL
jgi:hypothetical protein